MADESIQDVKVAAIVNFFGPTDLASLVEGPTTRNFAVRWFGSLPGRTEAAKRVSRLLTLGGTRRPFLRSWETKTQSFPSRKQWAFATLLIVPALQISFSRLLAPAMARQRPTPGRGNKDLKRKRRYFHSSRNMECCR